MHLTQIQFLIHEKKIPSLIELYIWNPKNEALMSTVQYQRLGHFTLSDNTKNNYKSRELKSVFLDHKCKYLKISFEKPFFNKFNPFNQIGIVRIVCHGAMISDYEGMPHIDPIAQLDTQKMSNSQISPSDQGNE